MASCIHLDRMYDNEHRLQCQTCKKVLPDEVVIPGTYLVDGVQYYGAA